MLKRRSRPASVDEVRRLDARRVDREPADRCEPRDVEVVARRLVDELARQLELAVEAGIPGELRGEVALGVVEAERVDHVGGADHLAVGDRAVDERHDRVRVGDDARADQRGDRGELARALGHRVDARRALEAIADRELERVERAGVLERGDVRLRAGGRRAARSRRPRACRRAAPTRDRSWRSSRRHRCARRGRRARARRGPRAASRAGRAPARAPSCATIATPG